MVFCGLLRRVGRAASSSSSPDPSDPSLPFFEPVDSLPFFLGLESFSWSVSLRVPDVRFRLLDMSLTMLFLGLRCISCWKLTTSGMTVSFKRWDAFAAALLFIAGDVSGNAERGELFFGDEEAGFGLEPEARVLLRTSAVM